MIIIYNKHKHTTNILRTKMASLYHYNKCVLFGIHIPYCNDRKPDTTRRSRFHPSQRLTFIVMLATGYKY